MISTKELAKKLGVSVATVSKALNDKSDIGAETKARIRKEAEKLGYVPNASARSLRTRRSYSIGVLLGTGNKLAISDEFFSRVFSAFKRTMEENHYEIIFINNHIDNGQRTYLEHCNYRGVDGILVAMVHYDEPEIQELLASPLPTVTLDKYYPGNPSVCVDYADGIEQLVDYAYSLGHRKIAYIYGRGNDVTRMRLEGFRRAVDKHGLKLPKEYLVEGEYLDCDVVAKLTEQLLQLPECPTCILYPNDYTAIGGRGIIYRNKMTIPEDISVIGYDGIPLANAVLPRLTTLAIDYDRMGQLAAEKLLKLIENGTVKSDEKSVIRGVIQTGESVKKLN